MAGPVPPAGELAPDCRRTGKAVTAVTALLPASGTLRRAPHGTLSAVAAACATLALVGACAAPARPSARPGPQITNGMPRWPPPGRRARS